MIGRRLGFALGYTALFVAVDLVFRSRSVAGKQDWLAWASTNVANLAHRPVSTMVCSALFAQGSLLVWTLLSLLGLGVLNWSLGNRRTALVVCTAHVVGTVVSEGVLAYLVATGRAPASDRYIVDVGPSYLVVSALVAGTAYGLGLARLPVATAFAVLSPGLFNGLSTADVTSLGHACAVVVGLALGWPLWLAARRRDGYPKGLLGLRKRQVTDVGSHACTTPRDAGLSPPKP